ncbi:MAG: A24 family peptidase [Pirellulaceae bacterium]
MTSLTLQVMCVLLFTGLACFWDVRTRKLPNWMTVPAFALGLLFHGVTGGWEGLQFALAGFGVGFGLLFALMLTGGGGGGDVKFMAALGTWLGWKLVLLVFIGSAVVAVLGIICMFTWSLVTRASQEPTEEEIEIGTPREQADAARMRIPYALPATVSAWVVLGLVYTAKWMEL